MTLICYYTSRTYLALPEIKYISLWWSIFTYKQTNLWLEPFCLQKPGTQGPEQANVCSVMYFLILGKNLSKQRQCQRPALSSAVFTQVGYTCFIIIIFFQTNTFLSKPTVGSPAASSSVKRSRLYDSSGQFFQTTVEFI